MSSELSSCHSYKYQYILNVHHCIDAKIGSTVGCFVHKVNDEECSKSVVDVIRHQNRIVLCPSVKSTVVMRVCGYP